MKNEFPKNLQYGKIYYDFLKKSIEKISIFIYQRRFIKRMDISIKKEFKKLWISMKKIFNRRKKKLNNKLNKKMKRFFVKE